MSDDWDYLTIDAAIARLQELKKEYGANHALKIPADPSSDADGWGGAYMASQIAFTREGPMVLIGPHVEDVPPQH